MLYSYTARVQKGTASFPDGNQSARGPPPLDEVDLFYEDPHAWLADHYGFSFTRPTSPDGIGGVFFIFFTCPKLY